MVSRRNQIVYQGTRRGLTSSETTMEDTHIWVMDADGSNRRELATIDNRQGAPQWSPDGTSVYFTLQEQGSVALYRVPLTGGEGEPIIQKRGRVRGFSLGADGEVAYVFHGEDDFPQLYLGSDKLTDSNRALLAEREVAETVSLRYQSFDGMAVEGFLTLPLHRRPGESASSRDGVERRAAQPEWATLQPQSAGLCRERMGHASSELSRLDRLWPSVRGRDLGDQNGGKRRT